MSLFERQRELCVLCGLHTSTSQERVRACFCGFSHVECVIGYVLQQELKHPNRPPRCRLCFTPYRITPAKTPVVQLLENITYVWFQAGCEILMSLGLYALLDAAVCVGGLFILCDAVGEEEALLLVKGMSPLPASNSCRLAALAAVAVNGFRCWEDALLATMHRWSKAPYVGWLLPQGGRGVEGEPTFVRHKPPSSGLVVIVEGMMLPTIAKAFGYCFFSGQSNLNRFLLGGLTFMMLRGFAGMYYKHTLFSRQLNLAVLNYQPEEPPRNQIVTLDD